MNPWLATALDEGLVKKLSEQEKNQQAGMAVAVTWFPTSIPHNPIAVDSTLGVIFDWSRLHGMLERNNRTSLTADFQPGTKLKAFAEENVLRNKNVQSTVTTISLDRPWMIVPLSEDAKKMSNFTIPALTTSAGTELKDVTMYQFQRGPPGQYPSRASTDRIMGTICAQLQQQGVKVIHYLSEFVIVSKNFDEGLHQTAKVHKALKAAGLQIDGLRSGMVPRAVTKSGTFDTLNLTSFSEEAPTSTEDEKNSSDEQKKTLKKSATFLSEDLLSTFVADAFVQWGCDCYHWGCRPLDLVGSQDALKAFLTDVVKSGLLGALAEKLTTADILGEIQKVYRGSSDPRGAGEDSLQPEAPSSLPQFNSNTATKLIPSSAAGKEATRTWSRFELRWFLLEVYGDGVLGTTQQLLQSSTQ